MARQNLDGGWGKGEGDVLIPSDSLPTAGVLYALSLLDPTSVDPALTDAAEYLLAQQRADGMWPSIYQTNNDRPILTTSWVDIALPYIYEVLSSYSVRVAHSVPLAGVSGIEVLTNTFVLPPTINVQGNQTVFGWQYNQPPSLQTQTQQFATRVLGMQPGEVRQISNGTVVTYLIESGSNVATLPPFFVTARHILSVSPDEQSTSPGQAVSYIVSLFNPTAQSCPTR